MRRFKVAAAVAAAGALCAVAGIVYTAMPASAQAATITKAGSWSTGYQGQVTVTNSTSSTMNGWKLEFSLPGGTTIANAWSSQMSVSGNRYTFTSMPWNGTLSPGASTSFGFIANGTGDPSDCQINGAACSGGGGQPPVTPPPVTPPPVTPPPVTPPPVTPPPVTPPPVTPPPVNPPPTSGTPLSRYGQLKVCGVNLCDERGNKVQLRGMSSHGLQWFSGCLTSTSLDSLATQWKADLLRIAMYVNEGGYESDRRDEPDPGHTNKFTRRVNELVDEAEKRGMYAIIDFHTLTPGDPNANIDNAKAFFEKVSKRNAGKKAVIYEIANEPNGVSWGDVKRYANQIVPIIQRNHPDAVIIVGTPGWSSLGVSQGGGPSAIMSDKLSQSNVMYAFHFYAASHKDEYQQAVRDAMSGGLPVFASEWGTGDYTGAGAPDAQSTKAWLALFDELKISYANWSFSDKAEASAALRPGTCGGSNFTGGALSDGGRLVFEHMSNR